MVNLTYDKKVSNKKYLAYSLILSLSLVLIGISLSSIKRKQKSSLFFIKICIGKIPPKITNLPRESSAVVGQRHNITCNAESCFGDRTRYQWFDSRQRDLSEVAGFSVTGGLLTISDVKKTTEGEYKCKVVDDYGVDQASVRLLVRVPPRIVRFRNLTIEENSTVTFECRAEGVPKPNVTLRRDDGLSGDSRFEVREFDEGDVRVLQATIVGVRRSDDGLYLCRASNAAGLAVQAGRLEVEFKPDMSPTSGFVKAWSGVGSRNLTCTAAANPSASLAWKFGGVPIDQSDERYQIFGGQSQSSLLVRTDDLEVFGEYTCEAENRLGKNSTVVTLEKVFAPGPVTEILFHRVTPTSITFEFIRPAYTGGMPVTSYVMRYKALTDIWERTVDWTVGSAYILTDVKPRTMYWFSLAARNAVGEGPRVTAGCVTPAETVPDAPRLLEKCPSVHPGRVRLRWEVPNGNGQPVCGFRVRYFRTDSCRQPSGETGRQQVVERVVQNPEESILERKVQTPDVEQNGFRLGTDQQQGAKKTVQSQEMELSGLGTETGRQQVIERMVLTPEIELRGLWPDSCYSVQVRAINKIGESPPGCLVLRTSKLTEGYLVRREDLDSVVCGTGLFILLGFGFLLYRVVSPVRCSRLLLMRSTKNSKAFVISGKEEKPKHGLFRV